MQIDNLRTYGRFLNLNNPKFYGEKIQWIKAYGRLERFTSLVDKYLVRDFVKEKIGEEYLPKIISIYDDVNEINYKVLPNKFVLKINDGSIEYGLHCFSGMAQLVEVHTGRYKDYREDYYNSNWTRLSLGGKAKSSLKDFEKPIFLEN